MNKAERNERRHELEPTGRGVIVFLTLPILLVALLLLGCGDSGADGAADADSTIGSTATTGSTAGPRARPETPRPPEPENAENAGNAKPAGATPDEGMPTGPVSFETAEEAYHDGRYDRAVTLFARYTEERPDNPWGQYMLGLSSWKAGDLRGAEEALQETTRMDSTHVKGWVNLARVRIDDSRPKEAEEAVRRALELDPDRGDTHRVMGLVAEEDGRTGEAAEAYRKAIVLNPRDAWSMNNLALIHIRRGEFERALGPLAQAVRIRDDVAAFHNNLGAALEKVGQFRAAEDSYRKADEAAGGYEKAAQSLGRVAALPQPDGTGTFESAAVADGFLEEIDSWRGESLAQGRALDESEPGPVEAGEAGETESGAETDRAAESVGDRKAETEVDTAGTRGDDSEGERQPDIQLESSFD